MNTNSLKPLKSDVDAKTAALESVPESERWDPVAGSVGQKVPTTPNVDEDEEGRSNQQRLIEKGIADAEHDQINKASKDSAT